MIRSAVKLIVYVAITIIVVLGIVTASQLLGRENILERITEWPDLELSTLEGESFSTASLFGEKPLALYYFNTECIYCQNTFSDLQNHSDLLENAVIVFISNEHPKTISQFLTEMDIAELTGLFLYHDYDEQIKDFYAIRSVPSIYLYDREGKLIQLYKGAVSLEKIGAQLLAE